MQILVILQLLLLKNAPLKENEFRTVKWACCGFPQNQLGTYAQIKNGGAMMSHKKYECAVCGREVSRGEYEDYDGMCWECWDDRLTEESDSMFDELL